MDYTGIFQKTIVLFVDENFSARVFDMGYTTLILFDDKSNVTSMSLDLHPTESVDNYTLHYDIAYHNTPDLIPKDFRVTATNKNFEAELGLEIQRFFMELMLSHEMEMI